jgi:hypothetical protein
VFDHLLEDMGHGSYPIWNSPLNGSYPIFGLYLQHDDPRMAGRLPFSNLCSQDQTVSLSPPDLMAINYVIIIMPLTLW